MSIAVLISGQMRSFAQCYPTQRWQIFRHYEPDIHFFVSCCDDEQARSVDLLREHFDNVHSERYADPTDLPVIPIEKGAWAPYANAITHDKLMLQHWGNLKVWEFFLNKSENKNFDTIIRIRPDIWIHRFMPVRVRKPEECYCPWWGKFGGVNDRLAVMGIAAAFFYFNVFNRITELMAKGCPFHPESLVAASLEGMTVRNTLMTEFSTLRMNGDRRWAEITPSDIVESICQQ
jgi:hypothetical protein